MVLSRRARGALREAGASRCSVASTLLRVPWREELGRNGIATRADDVGTRYSANPVPEPILAIGRKLAHWHPDEAAALSLGYAPRFVNPDTVKPYFESSSEAQEFDRRLMLISRAVETGTLKHQFSPAEFVAWADRINLELPKGLTVAIAKICTSHNVPSDEVNALREQNALLKLELDQCKAATKDPHPRERRSLQSMVAGMAVARYGFNPNADRNSATKAIVDDIERLGLSIDKDTVLTHLRERL